MSALEPDFGRQIKGPSAIGEDPRRFFDLMRALAITDWKLRFFGSALGYFWQLFRPLLLFGILYVVFTEFVRFDDGAKFYAAALLLGVVTSTFLNEATSGATTAIVDRQNLVRKIEFPRLAVPLATVLTALFNLALNLVVVLVFLVVSGGRVRLSWLELPVLVALLVALSAGAAMLLSALYVRARDVKPIWDVVLQLAFYASPIFYTIGVVAQKHDRVAHALMLNPFAAILQQARHAIVDPSHPSAAAAIGGTPRLIVPLAIIALTVAGGYAVFRRAAPRLAEQL